jgi:transposase
LGKAKRRTNPRATSRVNRNLLEMAATEIRKVVFGTPAPWKTAKTGRPPHNPRIVVCLLVLMEMFCYTYETAESNLTKSVRLKGIFDVENLPGHSTLHRGMKKLTQKYIRKLNRRLLKRFRRKGLNLIPDSSGFRLITSSHWYDIRIKRKNRRKDNDKLHLICDPHFGLIWNYSITDHRKHDSPTLPGLLRGFRKVGTVPGDPAYLSRENCSLVARLGGRPYFLPKKNSTPRAAGSSAWKWMIRDFLDDKDNWLSVYHIRSFVESVFSSIKRRFGSCVRAFKKRIQRRELALRVIGYNLKQVLYILTAEELGVDRWIKL